MTVKVTEKHTCSEDVWHSEGNWGHSYPCAINATVIENEKWWCKKHAPSLVKARGLEQRAKWAAEYKANGIAYAHNTAVRVAEKAVLEAANNWYKLDAVNGYKSPLFDELVRTTAALIAIKAEETTAK